MKEPNWAGEKSKNAAAVSRAGKMLVGGLLSGASRAPRKYFDFVLPNGKRLKVKTHFGAQEPKAVFTLVPPENNGKQQHLEWDNKLADHLVIVTKTNFIFANADDVRESIKKLKITDYQTGTYPLPLMVLGDIFTYLSRQDANSPAKAVKFLNNYFGAKVA